MRFFTICDVPTNMPSYQKELLNFVRFLVSCLHSSLTLSLRKVLFFSVVHSMIVLYVAVLFCAEI